VKEERPFLETPDGRYIVVRGRLWRKTNPYLPDDERKRLVSELMTARRAVKDAAGDKNLLKAARMAVDVAKTGCWFPRGTEPVGVRTKTWTTRR
jgi:hypothetical protein